jgi:hypothetical protein
MEIESGLEVDDHDVRRGHVHRVLTGSLGRDENVPANWIHRNVGAGHPPIARVRTGRVDDDARVDRPARRLDGRDAAGVDAMPVTSVSRSIETPAAAPPSRSPS